MRTTIKTLPAELQRVMTQVEELEARVAAGQEYMRAIFSAAKVGLCLLNSEGVIITVNATGRQLMQADGQASIIGRQFGDAFCCENSLEKGCGKGHNCRHCPVRRNIEAAMVDDDFTSEFPMQMKIARTGSRLWLRLGVSQIGAGSDKQIIVTIVDESLRKIYGMELERAKTAAEEAAHSKTQFISTMSHEIRTPLNGIVCMLEMAGREPLSDKQQECLQNARRSADDLMQILNDILDFAKLENGRLSVEKQDFDLHESLNRIANVYRQLVEAKGLKFVQAGLDELPRFINGDALRLRQVLHNMLSNALKFTEKGKITLAAYKSQRNGQPTLEFSVEDTGIGIDEKARKRLFRPFSQADSSTTRLYGGTGLGLTIARELVELMGGAVSLDSEIGRGTCLSFWIPLVEAGAAKPQSRIILRPRSKAERETEKKCSGEDARAENLMHYCMQKLLDGTVLPAKEG
ncbi:MAG: hypothetical protein ILA30_06665 [Selenomonas sp.]|nr:hypothetical protein [Selenomonas sp.]